MKYIIKMRTGLNEYGTRVNDGNGSPLGTLIEFAGNQSTPLTFESIADAEIYAQDHELPNYVIEPLNESTQGKQLLNG